MVKKQWVIDHWSGVVAASKALGVSHQALSKAPDVLPESMAKRVRAKIARARPQTESERAKIAAFSKKIGRSR